MSATTRRSAPPPTPYGPPAAPAAALTPESLAAACRAGRAFVVVFPSGSVVLATREWGSHEIALHQPAPSTRTPEV